MLSNYMKVAFRNLVKHKSYALLSIAGLTIGVTGFLLISWYVRDELSYDKQFAHSERIYRLVDDLAKEGGSFAIVPYEWTPAILGNIPEVCNIVRISTNARFTPLMSHGEDQFYESGVYVVDSTFFEIFNFEFLEGQADEALLAPDAIVLTEEAARKYFGQEPPLGKTLNYNNERLLQVTGVIRKPGNTHLQFDFLIRFRTLRPGMWKRTYLLLDEQADAAQLQQKLSAFIKQEFTELHGRSFTFNLGLQPLQDIHLHSRLQWELGPNGNIAYVYMLSALAVLLLGVGCFNFINLATARSGLRASEVGVRKVLGAHRKQLARQFIGETIIMAAVATLLSVGVLELILPAFNAFTGKALVAPWRNGILPVFYLIGFAGLIGIIAGGYPAFFLASFQPAGVLKGTGATRRRSPLLRKALVVSQFAVSIIMLVGTGVIRQQLEYVRQKNLGFDKEHVLSVTSRDSEINRRSEAVKAKLLEHPNIVNISFMQSLPGQHITTFGFTVPEVSEDRIGMTTFCADHDIIEALGLEVIEGRSFSKEFGTDDEAFILNEAAVKSLGWDEAVGKPFGVDYMDKWGRVVGVVKDFNFASLHQPIQPAVLMVMPTEFYARMAVRIRSADIKKTLAFIKEQMREFSPDFPFDYTFVDAGFAQLYRAEERLGQLFGYFALLAIVIACLGLFGLASFTAEQRTKEIGVRKVLGASVSGLVVLLSRDFLKLVGIAFAVSLPIAFLAMNAWLANFAYRIQPPALVFILAGIVTLLIAQMTVSLQAVKAARSNPVDVLKSE